MPSSLAMTEIPETCIISSTAFASDRRPNQPKLPAAIPRSRSTTIPRTPGFLFLLFLNSFSFIMNPPVIKLFLISADSLLSMIKRVYCNSCHK